MKVGHAFSYVPTQKLRMLVDWLVFHFGFMLSYFD